MRQGRTTPTSPTAPTVGVPTQRAGEDEVQALATPARAQRAVDVLRPADPSGAWMFNRVADGDFTILAGHLPDARLPIGAAYDWDATMCRAMLPAVPTARTASRGDLTVRPYDLAWQTAERWGVRSYVGAALRGPYGQIIGTLCSNSFETRDIDPALVVAVGDKAAALERSLANDLRRLEQSRGRDVDDVAHAHDPLTRLPGRAAWGLLLEREEERARQLADPAGLVLVDTGHLRTVRGLRRVVSAVTEVVGARGTVCRLGPRQLGVLCAGSTRSQVQQLGTALDDQMRAAGRGGAAGWASRRGLQSLQAAWEQAESALLAARRAAAGLPDDDVPHLVQLPTGRSLATGSPSTPTAPASSTSLPTSAPLTSPGAAAPRTSVG